MKKKILVVDDNDLNRKLAGFSLTKVGYDVIYAEDGADALSIALNDKPSLILMDINMEGWDGVATLKMIRREKCLSQVPVLAFTALAMKGDKERLIDDGFDDYISKPVRLNEMLEKIKNLCPLE